MMPKFHNFPERRMRGMADIIGVTGYDGKSNGRRMKFIWLISKLQVLIVSLLINQNSR